MLRGVFLGRDREPDARARAPGLPRLQPQLRARLRARRDADERDPLVAVAHPQAAIAAEMYARRLLRGAEADPRDAARHRRRARQRRGPGARRPSRRNERGRERQEEPAPAHERDSSSAPREPFAERRVLMDDHAFHRVDGLLPGLAREHLLRVGVAGLAARGDAGGREVDVLAVVVALELGREEAHDMHGGAAAVAGVALDVGVAALLLGPGMRELGDDVAQAVDLLVARGVAVGAARVLGVLLAAEAGPDRLRLRTRGLPDVDRSEEHTSELQSPCNLVCRLLL